VPCVFLLCRSARLGDERLKRLNTKVKSLKNQRLRLLKNVNIHTLETVSKGEIREGEGYLKEEKLLETKRGGEGGPYGTFSRI